MYKFLGWQNQLEKMFPDKASWKKMFPSKSDAVIAAADLWALDSDI